MDFIKIKGEVCLLSYIFLSKFKIYLLQRCNLLLLDFIVSFLFSFAPKPWFVCPSSFLFSSLNSTHYFLVFFFPINSRISISFFPWFSFSSGPPIPVKHLSFISKDKPRGYKTTVFFYKVGGYERFFLFPYLLKPSSWKLWCLVSPLLLCESSPSMRKQSQSLFFHRWISSLVEVV